MTAGLLEEAKDAGNKLWDCGTCRSLKLNVEARLCFLHLERVKLVEPIYGTFSRQEVVALTGQGTLVDELVGTMQKSPKVQGRGGRRVCPVPLATEQDLFFMALEVDAKEYGIAVPDVAAVRSMLKIIRSTRAEVQSARLKPKGEKS